MAEAPLVNIRLKKPLHISRPRQAGDIVAVSEVGEATAHHLISTGAATRASKDVAPDKPGLPSQEEVIAAEGKSSG